MVNAVPLAPTLTSPPNNGYEVRSEPIVFAWNFNDPGDIQTSASLRYKVPAGAWTTLTDVVTTPLTYTLPGATLVTDTAYEWQAQTKDSAGQLSPWSASWFTNTITAVPAPTITAPAPAAVIDTNPVLVSWDLPLGFTQDAFLITLTKNEAPWDLYYGSGEVHSVAQSVLVDVATAPGVPMLVYVSFIYHGYAASATRLVTNAVLPPETPLIVLAQVPDRPEVEVSITNPAPSDVDHLNTVSNDVTRNGTPIATGLPVNATYLDEMVGGGTVEYIVTSKTANGGTAESY